MQIKRFLLVILTCTEGLTYLNELLVSEILKSLINQKFMTVSLHRKKTMLQKQYVAVMHLGDFNASVGNVTCNA